MGEVMAGAEPALLREGCEERKGGCGGCFPWERPVLSLLLLTATVR